MFFISLQKIFQSEDNQILNFQIFSSDVMTSSVNETWPVYETSQNEFFLSKNFEKCGLELIPGPI